MTWAVCGLISVLISHLIYPHGLRQQAASKDDAEQNFIVGKQLVRIISWTWQIGTWIGEQIPVFQTNALGTNTCLADMSIGVRLLWPKHWFSVTGLCGLHAKRLHCNFSNKLSRLWNEKTQENHHLELVKSDKEVCLSSQFQVIASERFAPARNIRLPPKSQV